MAKWLFSCAAGLLLSGAACADIYVFLDEQGTAHLSNVPQDRRYRLLMRTPLDAVSAPLPGVSRGRDLSMALRARQKRFSAQVTMLAAAQQIDPALLHAVISAESGYSPNARSAKGAMGLMQLMPATARRFCVDDPYDPEQNMRGGALYLSELQQRYKADLPLMLAAYNAGEGAVARHGNRIPPYAETRQYVPRVLELYERYRRDGELSSREGAVAERTPRNSAGTVVAGWRGGCRTTD